MAAPGTRSRGVALRRHAARGRAWRAARRAPLEAQAEAALAEGRATDALRLPEQIVGQWPESAVARRIVSELEREDRESRIRDLSARADRVLEQGDARGAAALLRRALELGAKADVRWRLAELERETRAAEEEQTVTRVRELLGGGDHAAALLKYLSLDEKSRSALRSETGVEHLGWLEESRPLESGRKAGAAVEAVLALRDAKATAAFGEYETVSSMLAPHRRQLRHLRIAGSLLAEAADHALREDRAQALRRIEKASDAFRLGRIEEARACLDDTNLKLLDEERGEQAAALDRALRRVADLRRLEGKLASRRHDPVRAGVIVRRLIELNSGDERQRWLREHADLGDEVRSQWRIEIAEGAGADVAGAWPHYDRDRPELLLRDDGRQVLLANSWGEWIFIWLIDVEGGVVRERIRMRAPQALGPVIDLVVNGAELWIACEEGGLIKISLDDWRVLRWHLLGEHLKKNERIESVLFVPGTRFVWMEIARREAGELIVARVLDLDSRRICREFDDCLGMERSLVTPEAIFAIGDVDAAREAWEDGPRHDGQCELDLCLETIGPATPGEDKPRSAVRRLVLAIVETDRLLESGRPEEALSRHWKPYSSSRGKSCKAWPD
ncbi:MAG: hypothetical protein CME06_14570 [Gemmatimonadetes bacterium]|nr:hypothetical protein [Gemmatimonadota bacterium]